MDQLDRFKLQETHEWQLRNYQDAVRRVIGVIVDSIQLESKRALEREISYSPDIRSEYTYIDQASEIQHAILQAVNNADFRGLTRTAGEVHGTAQALVLLERLQAELPEALRDELVSRETLALEDRISEKKGRRQELLDRDANGCRAAVHQSGRGVGFYRCTNAGKHTLVVDERSGEAGRLVEPGSPGAAEVKLCGTHKREAELHGRIHLWKPTEYELRSSEGYRKQADAEIARMEARLQGALGSGRQLSIAAGSGFARDFVETPAEEWAEEAKKP